MKPAFLYRAAVAACTLIAAASASAVTIDIDATSNLSFIAGGPQNLLPGTVAQPANPVSLTLNAGTYVITNAANTGYYAAWNYGSGWVWSFIMAEHGGNIIEDAYTYDVLGSQAAVASETGTTTWNGSTQLSATSTAGFTDTFTLTHTTVLDFYVDDYNWGGGDNYGGVSINIQAVPEASTAAMWLAGLALTGRLARRRRA